MKPYIYRLSTEEIAAGTLSGLTALGFMIWQVAEDYHNEFMRNGAIFVLVLTVICMILTAVDFFWESLGGSKPLFSWFVIGTGLLATFAQTAILATAASLNVSYGLAAGVQSAQLMANGLMLAIIFSNFRPQPRF